MYILAFLVAVSFLLGFLITPLVRDVSSRLGVVDHPNDRKLHPNAIPRLGGVAVLVSYALAYGLALLAHFSTDAMIRRGLDLVWWLAPAVLIVFITGLIDDVKGIKPWQKLAGQIPAALLAYWAGIHLEGIAGFHFPMWLSLPATVLWLLACTNAVNLIDGVDGLATGVSLFAACSALFAGLLQNNIELAIATAPLAGCLLGFLRYNFNPATIFLGDCGSLSIGFLLGCYGVLWSEKSVTLLGMTAPLMALAVPLLDTVLAVIRRFLRRQPIFTADRGHIHHRLLDRGLTPRKVALILYGCCAVGAIASILMMDRQVHGLVIIVFCAITWIGIQQLGFVELGAVGRLFQQGAFRRTLSAQIALQTYEEQLIAAPTPEQCWEVILSACKHTGFHRVEVSLAGKYFEWQDGESALETWQISIPISDVDYVQLARTFDSGTPPNMVAPFADLLRRTLGPKVEDFAPVRAGLEAELALQESATGG